MISLIRCVRGLYSLIASDDLPRQVRESARAEIVRLRNVTDAQEKQLKGFQAELKEQLAAAEQLRADEARAAAKALEATNTAAEEAKASLTLELRRVREDLSAVRMRARMLAEDKEEELARMRAALTEKGLNPDGSGSEATVKLDDADDGWNAHLRGGSYNSLSSLQQLQAAQETAMAAGEQPLSQAALALSAKMQAARDAEANALRQRLAKVERALEDATAEATSATAENAELRLRLERSRAGEAAGFLKDVVFKYLVADETAKPTIFLLLASVLQFSKGEIAHIKRMQEDQESSGTASGLLSSFFLSAPPPEQEAFADAAAEGELSTAAEEQTQLPSRSSDDMRFELFAGRGPLGGAGAGAQSTPRAPPRAPAVGTPGFSVSATPLVTPFSEPVPAPSAASVAEKEELAECKKKVARLKKLLTMANEQIEKVKADLAARDAALESLTGMRSPAFAPR